MTAAILAIGDELTSGLTADTNSAWLGARLRERGVVVDESRIVSDDRRAIARAIAELARGHDLLCITGGLGPTPDDLTREALGDVVTPDAPLEVDAKAFAAIAKRFADSGRTMPAMNARQAERPRGAAMLANDRGTAPGLDMRWGECRIVVMPGVPAEMKAMFERFAREALPGAGLAVRSVHTFGIGESDLATRLGDVLARGRRPQLGTAAGGGGVSVRAYGRENEADAVEAALVDVERAAGPYAFGRDDATLASSLGELLAGSGKTLVTAESCTGGLLGAMLTDVSGSSRWYRGGWVTYSNAMKESEIGVPRDLLRSRGAVSAEVAAAMACGARNRSGADIALAITGIAGPSGGSAAKPAGTVFISCAVREASQTEVRTRHFRFTGDRGSIRRWAALSAMQMARFALLAVDPATPLLREVAPPGGVMTKHPPRAWIALGSNLGDRAEHIRTALRELAAGGDVRVRAVSTLLETDAVGPGPQPRYLNAAAELATTLSPRQLMERLLEVERRGGRERSPGSRNAARTIDLDLLLYEDAVIDEPGLTIPHPRLHERDFVLRPLAEIAAEMVHPALHATIGELLCRLQPSLQPPQPFDCDDLV